MSSHPKILAPKVCFYVEQFPLVSQMLVRIVEVYGYIEVFKKVLLFGRIFQILLSRCRPVGFF